MDLLALADFNLVARHGGFGRAARATGRPKATLSRHVAQLEDSLETRLFERGARSPRLTQEGRVLHERTAALLGEIDGVAAEVASGGAGRPRGHLRISVPVLFAQAAMGKLAAGFGLLYPDVRLEATAEDRAVDLVEEDYELAIRVNPHPDQELVGRCFLRDHFAVVAAPGVARPAGDEPVRAVMLGSANLSLPWRAVKDGAAFTLVPDPVLRVASLLMVRDAVRAGAGVALLPVSLVGGDLARGRLTHWGDAEGRAVELWALHTSRRLPSARVSAFLAYLARAFPSGTPEELAAFVDGG